MVSDVFGRFLLVLGVVSYPPGPILESMFLGCISVVSGVFECFSVGFRPFALPSRPHFRVRVSVVRFC